MACGQIGDLRRRNNEPVPAVDENRIIPTFKYQWVLSEKTPQIPLHIGRHGIQVRLGDLYLQSLAHLDKELLHSILGISHGYPGKLV